MRNQVKFVFQIGYAAPHAAFETAIIKAASLHCGGCTTSAATGWWWCEDGATHAETFKGSLEREHCFQLELTCEERKAETVLDAMRLAMADAAARYGVETDWVHVSETAITGRHFSIAAIQAERATVAA